MGTWCSVPGRPVNPGLRYTGSMRRLILAMGLAAVFAAPCTPQARDRVFAGGVVHGPEGAVRAAILVRGGRIAALGPLEELGAAADAEIVELGGAHVLPGLCDAHLHFTGYGRSLEEVDLHGATSWEEVVRRARAAAEGLPAGAWLTGRGWDQNLWPLRAFPDRAALDEAIPNRPVWLRRVDGHAAVANSRALAAAGVDRSTPDPPGGRILRRADGTPTGVFVDGAMELVSRVIPAPDEAALERWMLRAGRELAALGFTQVHDAGTTARELAVLRRLEAEGRLPLRVYVLLDGSDPGLLERELPRGPSLDPEGRLRIGGVKLYADGALGSRGALLGGEYADDPGNRGLAVTPVEELRSILARASRAGFQVGIHAIGDEAVHRVLELYAELGAATCRRLRHRVEHAQVVRPTDVPWFARLGVVASIQPTHCTSDMPWAPDRLGPRRIPWAYRWRSLLQAGAVLAGGSDAPVEDPDPRLGLFAAVTRRRPDGTPPGGWNPAERLAPAEALELFTTGPAWAGHAERWSGVVAPGFAADLTIVDRDPTVVPPTEILEMRVLRTVVGGRDAWVADGRKREEGDR